MKDQDIGERELAIFSRRSARLAQSAAQMSERENDLAVLVCEVGSVELGIPTAHIDLVMVAPPITSLPTPSDILTGIVQVRGAVQAVVDLPRWLGVERKAADGQIVVVRSGTRTLGLLVDRAQALRSIGEDELARDLGQGSADALPVRAVTQSFVNIVDLDRLFSHPKVAVVSLWPLPV